MRERVGRCEEEEEGADKWGRMKDGLLFLGCTWV